MIRTIAIHTLRESLRKKTLHVLIGLSIFIMAVLPVIPTTDEPDAMVKMLLVVFFQVVVLLCITGVILLSATSLPHEIEDKTIYGILSKPVSRLKIIVGKIIGFALLSALLLVILGLFNLVSIQYRASNLPEEYGGIVKARSEFAASHFSIQGKLHHAHQGIAWIAGGRSGVARWQFSDIKKPPENASGFEIEGNLKLESSRGFVDTIPLMVRVEDEISGRGKTEVILAKVAISLDCGCGVKRNRAEAGQWLRKAADQGHVGAQSVLGWKYMIGDGVPRDDGVAFGWLRRAVERGNTSAQNNLGILYAQGRGVTADPVEAERWFRSADEKGAADAQRNLDALLAGRRRDVRSISEPPLRRT